MENESRPCKTYEFAEMLAAAERGLRATDHHREVKLSRMLTFTLNVIEALRAEVEAERERADELDEKLLRWMQGRG